MLLASQAISHGYQIEFSSSPTMWQIHWVDVASHLSLVPRIAAVTWLICVEQNWVVPYG